MENKPKKKNWRAGVEMPEFSGKSFRYLQDLWPAEMRTSSEAFYIMAGMLYASRQITVFMKSMLDVTGRQIRFMDLLLLAWCLRCEDAKEGLCTEAYALKKGLDQGMKTLWIRKAILTKYGLIENIPTPSVPGEYFKAYRVTEKGRIILRKFVELIDEAHRKLREEWSTDRPDWTEPKGLDNWIRRMTDPPTSSEP